MGTRRQWTPYQPIAAPIVDDPARPQPTLVTLGRYIAPHTRLATMLVPPPPHAGCHCPLRHHRVPRHTHPLVRPYGASPYTVPFQSTSPGASLPGRFALFCTSRRSVPSSLWHEPIAHKNHARRSTAYPSVSTHFTLGMWVNSSGPAYHISLRWAYCPWASAFPCFCRVHYCVTISFRRCITGAVLFGCRLATLTGVGPEVSPCVIGMYAWSTSSGRIGRPSHCGWHHSRHTLSPLCTTNPLLTGTLVTYLRVCCLTTSVMSLTNPGNRTCSRPRPSRYAWHSMDGYCNPQVVHSPWPSVPTWN